MIDGGKLRFTPGPRHNAGSGAHWPLLTAVRRGPREAKHGDKKTVLSRATAREESRPSVRKMITSRDCRGERFARFAVPPIN